MTSFNETRWGAAYRRVARRAEREVPYYREHGIRPVPAAELGAELYRLCPLGAPWRPDREPPPWDADPSALREALRIAGKLRWNHPVLEVRDALADRPRRWPRHATVLSARADTGGAERRERLNGPARELAGARHAVLVGDAAGIAELAPLFPHVDAVVLPHDRYLGYLGARVGRCGAVHLNWRRFHARVVDGRLAVTVLAARRPTLVDVVPHHDGWTLSRCPLHATPVLDGGS